MKKYNCVLTVAIYYNKTVSIEANSVKSANKKLIKHIWEDDSVFDLSQWEIHEAFSSEDIEVVDITRS